jgi:hypothetical protein
MDPKMERVEVKSAWMSKINWTQGVSLAATLLAIKGFTLDADTQIAIVTGIQSVQAVATWAFRTFFNRSVGPASL